MFFRMILTILFLANLVMYVWLTATAPTGNGVDVVGDLIEAPVEGLQEAKVRLEMLEGLPKRLRDSNAKLSWLAPMLLLNAVAFIFSIAYVSITSNQTFASPNANDSVGSTDG